MAIVVIGGHSRSVGKTSVVAGLIAALPELRWTALKITQYGHGICSANGEACDCATSDHSWAISEERDRSGESDTSRFLVAGALRALWVRIQQCFEVPAARCVFDGPQSSDRRFQKVGAGVSGPGKCSDPPLCRKPRKSMARRFPETSGRGPDFSHQSAAVYHSGDHRICPLGVQRNAEN